MDAHHAYDESMRLRIADASNRDDATRDPLGPPQPSVGVACVTTVISSYPTAAGAWYAVSPLIISGTETEGGPFSTATGTNKFLAYNLGTAVPPQGTKVYVEYVPYRNVFRFDG